MGGRGLYKLVELIANCDDVIQQPHFMLILLKTLLLPNILVVGMGLIFNTWNLLWCPLLNNFPNCILTYSFCISNILSLIISIFLWPWHIFFIFDILLFFFIKILLNLYIHLGFKPSFIHGQTTIHFIVIDQSK